MQSRARPCVVVPTRFPDEGRRGHGRHGGRGGDAGRRLRGGGGRHRRLGGRREQGGLRAGERRHERLLVGRHVPRAQRCGLPGRRREPHPAARGARGLGLRMRHLRGGRGRRRAQRGGARGRAGRADHLRGGSGPARRQRPGGRHVRHPRRLEAAGVQALRVPQLSLRRAQAGRLGHRRVPLRLRPAAHPPHRGRGRPLHRLDGRLRRALALGRGAGLRGTEELDARPPRAQDEGRHRRHVRVRSAPRRAVPLPESGRGARAGRRRPRRGRGGPRGLRRGEVHPRRARRHPHGRRLLQQQGALAALHTHGGHGLRKQLPHGGRDGRVLPHGARRERRRVGLQQLGELRRRRGLGGRGRPVGALPLRRHDAAVAPAVVHRRPLRQPPALHGQPRGRGRRERHLRAGRSWPPSR